jgi:uncharacterized NAD(P)/FAD-binding protein YdhS
MTEDELASDDAAVALEALQRKLAADLAVAPASVSAQIAGQLRQVIKDRQALGPKVRSVVDDLADRRQNRESAAEVVARPKRRGQQRSS